MREKPVFAVTAVCMVVFACGGGGEISTGGGEVGRANADEAYAAIGDLYEREASDEEKLAATIGFLEQYPDSDPALSLVGDVLYFRGEKARDMEGAIDFAERIRSKVKDPERALKFDRRLIAWYGGAEMKARMLSLADRLEQEGSIRFGDYVKVIDSALAMEEWALAREYCSKAQSKANASTWRAEWPDTEATDEEAENAGLNRQGILLVKDSWARANLGEAEEALAGFERAGDIVYASYLGAPAENLAFYWGKARMMQGDAEGAMEKFALDALIGGDDDARAELKLAYAAANGSEDGYDAWASSERLRIAKVADDFELPDLNGVRHQFADLRGEVTLLNFWSPT